jgi:adenylyl-sulfate kinase
MCSFRSSAANPAINHDSNATAQTCIHSRLVDPCVATQQCAVTGPIPVDRNAPEGLAILFTGLPASGKTTLATGLFDRLRSVGCQATMLDGDSFRSKIAPELGFSASDRSSNLRRAGIIAAEIVRHGGIVICSFIAPYEGDRLEFRKAVEQFGRFVLIHLCTPLSECERRDPKGMYVKARSGIIRNFTGVSDIYEEPEACEIRINTMNKTIDETVDSVIQQLARRAFSVKIWLAYGKPCRESGTALKDEGIAKQSDGLASQAHMFQAILTLLVSDRVSINEAANALKTGRHTVERTVRSITNMTFRDLQQALILEKAKSHLDDGRSIKDVAFLLGFGSPQAFHRFFMKASGTTPSTFQRGCAAVGLG